MEATPTRYAPRRGGGLIAYQILGSAPDVLLDFGSGTYLSIDESHDEPHFARFLTRLSAFVTVVRFDPCAIGLSDTPQHWDGPTLEGWAGDGLAVMDDARVDSAIVLASVGASMPALVLAAQYPERVRSLVLHSGAARLSGAPDYKAGLPESFYAGFLPSIQPNAEVAGAAAEDLGIFAAGLAPDPSFAAWWSRAARRGARPDVAGRYTTLQHTSDVRHLLSEVRQPVLVTKLSEGRPEPVAMATYLANHLPTAQLVEVPGPDLLPFASGGEVLLRHIETWITGARPVERERHLRAVLFTDIVGSTAAAVAAGDRRWKDNLQDFALLARREIERLNGCWLKDTGDGSLATFVTPRDAISCAKSLLALAHQHGLALRAGAHFAEVETRESDDIGGVGVHLAARIAALAGPDEIYVSSTVVEVLEGADDPRFEDCGRHILKGIPGERQIWRLANG